MGDKNIMAHQGIIFDQYPVFNRDGTGRECYLASLPFVLLMEKEMFCYLPGK